MYTSFFGLNEKPFSITPDPRYLFMSERHSEALAHLVYGITESNGFMQLTGEVGTGKTTLVRTLLQNRLPNNADIAVILNPQLSALEFLQTICEELGVDDLPVRASSKALIDALNHYLLTAHANGRRTIVVVDEAQNLARDVLEQVRLLTNLETSKRKLLQIVLIGQPELREVLARSDLRQLAQRITGRYHLEPLSRVETARYIEHRLRVAGALGDIFESGAKREVFNLSHGVPRVINVICDRALLGAYSQESRVVNRHFVRRAAAEISGSPAALTWLRWMTAAMTTAAVALLAFGAWTVYSQQPTVRAAAEPVLAVAPPSVPDDEPPVAILTAETIPIAESEAETTLNEQLLLASDMTDTETALTTLFGVWGFSYDGRGNGCEQAREAGYDCLFQRGSWNNLRQLDRPAMLTLTDSRGDAHDVVLRAIHGDQADLSIGPVDVSHPIDQVSELWFGQYMLLWKPADGVSRSLAPGTKDPKVAWLRASLAEIDERYRALPLDSDEYDAILTERVRAFQRDHRLKVDGLAGRQTQIVINSLLVPQEMPRLTVAQD